MSNAGLLQSRPSLISSYLFRLFFVAVLALFLYDEIRDAARLPRVTSAVLHASSPFSGRPLRLSPAVEKARGSMATDLHPCWRKVMNPNVSSTPAEARCCLRFVRDSFPIALTQTRDGPWLRKRGFSKYFISSLPSEEVPRYNRCAVVSNSPAMRLHRAGREIDRMDAVFRMNVAPVRGYEKHVGFKETIRVANTKDSALRSKHVQNAGKYGKLFLRAEDSFQGMSTDARHQNLSQVWNSRNWGGDRSFAVLDTVMNWTAESEGGTVYVSHPTFSQFSLFRLLGAMVKPTNRVASTGTVALILALMSCEHVVSYELMANSEQSKKHRYYYRERGSKGGYGFWHPQGPESQFQELFATRRRGTTNIYEFDMASSSAPGNCDKSAL